MSGWILAVCVSTLVAVGCYPSGVYVGVAVPGPWYGPYPYPYGGVGVWGRPPGRLYDEDEVPMELYPVCETPPLSPEGG